MCVLEFQNERNLLEFLQFMNDNANAIYNIFTFKGMNNILIVIILICILIEFLDMEFTVNPAILKQLYQLNDGIEHN